jgi:hypothetical protein
MEQEPTYQVVVPSTGLTEQEPTYPVVVPLTDLPPWSGPPPYCSAQDPFHALPMFPPHVSPADCDRYHRYNILHYFTNTMKRSFKIKSSVLLYFSSLRSRRPKRGGYVFLQKGRYLVVEKNKALQDNPQRN